MTQRKPTFCVVAGPNGSGKTTTTVQLLNDEWTADSLYINPDNIAQETFGDWNSPEAVLKAAELATQQRYDCLQQGRDFVFETVFLYPPVLRLYFRPRYQCRSHHPALSQWWTRSPYLQSHLPILQVITECRESHFVC